jgi:ribosomal protein S18 acetylase RimI-like enzyme
MAVLFDLVLNHSAREHPYFQDAYGNPDSPYWEWYDWQDSGEPETYFEWPYIANFDFNSLEVRRYLLDAVDQWFSDERLQDLLEEDERVFLPVATVGEEAVAFAQCHLVETPERVGEIHWLHVDPDHRNKGIGQALMDHVIDRFHELGVDRLKGLVFAKNEVGCDFFEANGFDLAYTHTQTVAGRSFTENVYVRVPGDEPWRTELEPVETPEGRKLYVAYKLQDYNWLTIHTAASVLTLVVLVPPGAFEASTLAERVGVETFDPGESLSEKLGLGSSVLIANVSERSEQVVVRIKEGFSIESEAFKEFLREAYEAFGG